jgi:hypothetical protein
MAMRINFFDEVVGSVQQRKQIWFSQELEQIRKESRLNSVG